METLIKEGNIDCGQIESEDISIALTSNEAERKRLPTGIQECMRILIKYGFDDVRCFAHKTYWLSGTDTLEKGIHGRVDMQVQAFALFVPRYSTILNKN